MVSHSQNIFSFTIVSAPGTAWVQPQQRLSRIPRSIHVPGELCVLDEFISINFFLHFLSGHKVVIWIGKTGKIARN